MKNGRNLFLMLLSVLMLTTGAFHVMHTVAYADVTVLASGTCGGSVTWELTDNGLLTVSGTGDMDNFYSSTTIPWYTYRYYITNVVISEGVTSIGASAFYNCYNLKGADIAASVSSIGDGAFADTALEEITGMSGVITFGNYVFQGTALTAFAFPEGTETIENYPFYNCSALTEITIPASVTSIGENPAYNAPAVTAFHVSEGNAYFCDVDGILYDLGETTLLAYPAAKEGSSFTVPDTVTTLAPYCFSYQTQLKTVEIPAAVTTIGDGAFYYMSALEQITIPETVTSVGYFTFEGSALQTLYFNASVSSTPYRMCYECLNLKTASFGNEMLVQIYNWAFPYCSSLSEVTLPPKLERIEASTFYGCENLTVLEFPSTIIFIDGSAFINSGISEFPSWLTKTGANDYALLGQITLTGTEQYDMSYEVLYLVNAARTAEGLEPLAMDEELLEAAMQRAAETAVDFSHTRPDGSTCFSASSKMAGENITVAHTTASGAMDAWMNSEGHRANILGSDYKSIGVGCFNHNGICYWVQCFGMNEATDFTAPFTQTAKRTVKVQTNYLQEENCFLRCVDDSVDMNQTEKLTVCMINQGWSMVYCTPDASDFDWTSNDRSVATVDSDGVVTIVGSGEYTISAKLKTAPYSKFTYTNGAAPYHCYGDADGDGTVSAADALNVLQIVVRLKTADAQTEKASDVDADGEVTAADALLILQKVVRLIDSFPAEAAAAESIE